MKYSIHECPVSGHLCNCDEPCYSPGAAVERRSWAADEFTLRDDDGNKINKTIIERIEKIEQRMSTIAPWFGDNHGTMLQRVAAPSNVGGVQWSLGIGFLMMPKVFFRGQNVYKLLDEAEAYLTAQESCEGVPFAIVKNEGS